MIFSHQQFWKEMWNSACATFEYILFSHGSEMIIYWMQAFLDGYFENQIWQGYVTILRVWIQFPEGNVKLSLHHGATNISFTPLELVMLIWCTWSLVDDQFENQIWHGIKLHGLQWFSLLIECGSWLTLVIYTLL